MIQNKDEVLCGINLEINQTIYTKYVYYTYLELIFNLMDCVGIRLDVWRSLFWKVQNIIRLCSVMVNNDNCRLAGSCSRNLIGSYSVYFRLCSLIIWSVFEFNTSNLESIVSMKIYCEFFVIKICLNFYFRFYTRIGCLILIKLIYSLSATRTPISTALCKDGY